ncbi:MULTISPECIES: glycosyltransferase family protein [Arenibacter]|uniref:hypothetical protein n=1 Tax=Arenibacter TaxID=178469 RepID=UPI0004DF037B|nr:MULTISPECIES: hypothetical protein [Arenibacter]GBF18516.1 hypothetical protein C21_00674 [Arenibacter sp. NBRC 103722]
MNILFFISHQPNPRFVKQINFLAKNNTVSLAYFQRKTLADLDSSIDASVVRQNFGQIPNASRPVKRIWTYLKTIKSIKKLINANEFDVVLVNNLDVLLLYLFSRFKLFGKRDSTKVAIEISDLRKYVFSDGFMAKRLRGLEKRLYRKHIDKLIVTSEKYYTYHFEKFFSKDVFILENKLLSQEIKITESTDNQKSDKIVIGIVGLLLRKDEYIKLFETYREHAQVEIHVYGKGQYQGVVEEYAAKYSNIKYFGPYNAFTDTKRIYESIDIIYLIYDIHQVSLNNRLALPNKLYECMYYCVPLLCSKDTYLEEKVKEYGVGVSIDYKVEGEIEAGVEFLMINADKMKLHFKTLSKNLYLGDTDYVELESFLIQ